MERLQTFILPLFLYLLHFHFDVSCSSLYPRYSETREIQELNGMWNFRADFSTHSTQGFERKWYNQSLSKTGPVIPMPVPSSFNDITTDKKLRDFVGVVWYDREFYVSSDWQKKRIVLRVDSAHYSSIVYINGKTAFRHVGGHLPFEGEVNALLNHDRVNRVTIAVDNTLTPHTLPPGTITYHTGDPRYPPGYFVQNLQFDFFNYAGIHRQVRLYTTPLVHIKDITIITQNIEDGKKATLSYEVEANPAPDSTIDVEVIDKDGVTVVSGSGAKGNLSVNEPNLWWPYTMDMDDYGYQYIFKVTLKKNFQRDIYRQPFGIRTVSVTSRQILINKKPFYCHGAGKHEDSDIRGKGLDYPLIARDFNMLKWLGANCFRTSHYPYAEEIMDQADKQGIVVIDECPGVGITQKDNFGNVSLQHHLNVMSEFVQRDKNRPSVMAWSVANEPNSHSEYSEPYFKAVIEHTRKCDKTRPVTFVSNSDFNKDRVAKYTDFQCINRYYGWYQDAGHLETIHTQLSYDLENWYKTLGKPLVITEYGADTVPGLHTEPSFMFTEEFQLEFMKEYHKVFDKYRSKFLVGEMVWNFADFMTDQSVTRVVGNKKGVLTRQRQPKAAGHLLRDRYWGIINGTSPHHVEL